IDTVAAGWKGLISDVLGVSDTTSTNLISEARDKGRALIGSLQQFSGVDLTLEQALQGQGINGPAALANANAATLAVALNRSPTYVQTLIDQARNAVPASEWSLAVGNLGLSRTEVDGLASRGITTQKELQDNFSAGSDAQKGELAGMLGRSTEDLSNTLS